MTPGSTQKPGTSWWRVRAVPLLKRLVTFNAVGWLGTLVNSGVLYLMKGVLDVPLVLASVIAIEMAIIHNFTWHRLWTWRKREVSTSTPFLLHLLQYNAATGVVDLVINVSVLWLLATFAGVHYLLANLAGMVLGPLVKFWLNERVLFRRKKRPKPSPEPRTSQRTDPMSESERQPKATRENRASLAKVEKKVLRWMAARLPLWITPDILTVVGLIAAVIIAAGYMLTAVNLAFLWLASAGLVLNWWGDSLDGTVARVRKIERPKYGFFVDHYCDALSTVIICAGMGLSPIMTLPVALSLIIGYLLLMILSYLTTLARGRFKIAMGGVGPTEIRIGIIVVNTVVWALGNPVIPVPYLPMTLFTLAGVLVAVGFAIFFLTFGMKEGRMLSRMDRPGKPVQATSPSGNGRTPDADPARSTEEEQEELVDDPGNPPLSKAG